MTWPPPGSGHDDYRLQQQADFDGSSGGGALDDLTFLAGGLARAVSWPFRMLGRLGGRAE